MLPFIYTYLYVQGQTTPIETPKLHTKKKQKKQKNNPKPNPNKPLQEFEMCIKNIWVGIALNL